MPKAPRKPSSNTGHKDLVPAGSGRGGRRTRKKTLPAAPGALVLAAQEAFGLDVVQLGQAAPTLLLWAARYMEEEVVGVLADNTVSAKRNDLQQFLSHYGESNGHLVASEWMKRDTKAFMRSLEKRKQAPATINRKLRTVKTLARWMHAQPDSPFAATGLPTRGVKELEVEKPDAAKLSQREVTQLFKAADRATLTATRTNARPRRNRAILAVLYFTGLRVNELVNLSLDQWDGKRFHNVQRKGRTRSKTVGMGKQGRELLDDYLQRERDHDDDGSGWLFLSTRGGNLTRKMVWLMLRRLAEDATKHGGEIHIYPHRLRHTFGSIVQAKTGDAARTADALAHANLQHVGRYTRPTLKEREALLDSITVEGD